ncbi:class I SAM-dependent methyltransferase [uncultured Alcanivorax sp.]|jgi:ubiquinone/menaquinone biosynthesis C-methylase UbiE|uniref:class I SAM-dependent methyltransferase n=1 Tax=uncultured Alcanivorax sp. TaxID=191215 RepID=UPI002603BCC8|nr:class I SAM-dependent methyltransferase [uncultured Alcanivorax sp.]
MKSAQQFWDKAAARYAKSPVKDEASYQKKLAITRDYFQPDWSVFEFGCGTGSTAILHAPFVRDILATDVSAKMLEIAEAKARDGGIDNIRFQQGTLDSLSLTPGSFDAVLGLNILHLVEDPEAAISRVSSLLKPGGVFVSNTVLADDMKLHWRLLIPLMQALGFAPHVSRFGKKGLLAMLARAGFDIDHEWQPDSLSVFIVARKRA